MNVTLWRWRNRVHKARNRITHPWPVYVKSGGIDAIVTRANGRTENLGKVSTTYAKRWHASGGLDANSANGQP